jgi:hypothetical protein
MKILIVSVELMFGKDFFDARQVRDEVIGVYLNDDRGTGLAAAKKKADWYVHHTGRLNPNPRSEEFPRTWLEQTIEGETPFNSFRPEDGISVYMLCVASDLAVREFRVRVVEYPVIGCE